MKTYCPEALETGSREIKPDKIGICAGRRMWRTNCSFERPTRSGPPRKDLKGKLRTQAKCNFARDTEGTKELQRAPLGLT